MTGFLVVPGAQLADDVSKKADEVKDAADEAKNTLIGSAIHAKDVAVEKAQEIGHTVSGLRDST